MHIQQFKLKTKSMTALNKIKQKTCTCSWECFRHFNFAT